MMVMTPDMIIRSGKEDNFPRQGKNASECVRLKSCGYGIPVM